MLKNLIFAVLILVATISYSFALDYEGKIIDTSEIEKLLSNKVEKRWQSSQYECYAWTNCQRGGQIHCRVYGSQYINGNGGMNNSCQWMVIPGRAVRCAGYQQQCNQWGCQWAWIDIPVRCY
ncbi:MAG: hypothetical protein ACI9QD_000546 [Thermoproteota archaeon]|jgi:hypothetical protein